MIDKNNKKWLFEFEINTKKDDSSEEVITKKFGILKPNRKMKEDGELFYASETSRFAKAGVLPRAAWNTILSNGGGSISEKDRELYGELLLKFRDLTLELQSILLKTDSEKTDAEKLRSDELFKELDIVRKDLQSFESSQIEIFENTAEAKARNRSILWWTLFLSYEFNGDKAEHIIPGDSFEEKLDYYDNLYDAEVKNDFELSLLRRFTYLITVWYLGKANSKDDFKIFNENYESASEQKDENI